MEQRFRHSNIRDNLPEIEELGRALLALDPQQGGLMLGAASLFAAHGPSVTPGTGAEAAQQSAGESVQASVQEGSQAPDAGATQQSAGEPVQGRPDRDGEESEGTLRGADAAPSSEDAAAERNNRAGRVPLERAGESPRADTSEALTASVPEVSSDKGEPATMLEALEDEQGAHDPGADPDPTALDASALKDVIRREARGRGPFTGAGLVDALNGDLCCVCAVHGAKEDDGTANGAERRFSLGNQADFRGCIPRAESSGVRGGGKESQDAGPGSAEGGVACLATRKRRTDMEPASTVRGPEQTGRSSWRHKKRRSNDMHFAEFINLEKFFVAEMETLGKLTSE
uniref:Uncharacterized protein n=2 Tax=Tetraselmis sp. GSL018 TaxID=582737 RepID=A0A061S9D3_9CHLO